LRDETYEAMSSRSPGERFAVAWGEGAGGVLLVQQEVGERGQVGIYVRAVGAEG
jgi:hypothetical protein